MIDKTNEAKVLIVVETVMDIWELIYELYLLFCEVSIFFIVSIQNIRIPTFTFLQFWVYILLFPPDC